MNPEKQGTKCAAHYVLEVKGGEEFVVKVRLFENSHKSDVSDAFSQSSFEDTFTKRKKEADDFYKEV